MESVNAKYVSQKISKTRWKPVSYSSLQQPEVFATGSWDNEVGNLSLYMDDKGTSSKYPQFYILSGSFVL